MLIRVATIYGRDYQSHLILLGPWALWRLINDSYWNAELIIALLVSATANSIYFLALRKAYYYALVSLVYPVARSSRLLIALWALLLFEQEINISGITGMVISAIEIAVAIKVLSNRPDSRWRGFLIFNTLVNGLGINPQFS